jgi:hypothetical protein
LRLQVHQQCPLCTFLQSTFSLPFQSLIASSLGETTTPDNTWVVGV